MEKTALSGLCIGKVLGGILDNNTFESAWKMLVSRVLVFEIPKRVSIERCQPALLSQPESINLVQTHTEKTFCLQIH